MKNNLITILKTHNLIKQIANEPIITTTYKKYPAVYCGIDPTAPSLHIGNLVVLLTLKRFAKTGFTPIVVIGGSTGEIGDPSGKKKERQLIDLAVIKKNIDNLKQQIKHIIPNAMILNNQDWLEKITLVEFLRNTGKQFNIPYLLNKHTVKSRINSGISFTEFSYNLIQAYDFNYLWTKYNCKIQIGGSDQWGNITSGIELIKSINSTAVAAGLTIPLLTKADGTKFGKSETQQIWLNPNLTTPYELYQFLYNQTDDMVQQLLSSLTMLSMEKIKEVIIKSQAAPQQRCGQLLLASEVTKLIHGETELKVVEMISKALFTGNLNSLNEKQLVVLAEQLPTFEIKMPTNNLTDLLINHKIFRSRRELREFINQKAICINEIILTNLNEPLSKFKPIKNNYWIIRRGKKKLFTFYLQQGTNKVVPT